MYKRLRLLTILAAFLIISACKKDNNSTPVTKYPIAGLWIGTYIFSSQAPLYFSFTVYPDGSMSYKSKGSNDYTFYANGSWTLSGASFSYSVTTTNTPGGTQSVQTGTATYSDTGTLTNGVNKDVSTNAQSTFSMTRVN